MKVRIKQNSKLKDLEVARFYYKFFISKLKPMDEREVEKVIRDCPSIKFLIGYFEQIHETSTDSLITEVTKAICNPKGER